MVNNIIEKGIFYAQDKGTSSGGGEQSKPSEATKSAVNFLASIASRYGKLTREQKEAADRLADSIFDEGTNK